MSLLQISLSSVLGAKNCPVGADQAFGPSISQRCRGFDFTMMFEQTILSILPSSIFLILVVCRSYYLHGSTVKIGPNYLGAFKAATAIVYAALQLSLLVQWSTDSPKPISASIPSAALSLVAALTICHLSFTEHRRSIRPSTLLNFYLLITLVLDAVQARTLFLLQDAAAIASVYTAAISIKLLLLILEAQSKASILRPSYRSLSPEETAGILNRLFLWWINSVFVTGYRKLLTGDDLPRLDAELSSEHMRKVLQRAWDERSKIESQWALLFAIARCFRLPLALIVFPRSCLIALRFAQPFLISRTINLVSGSATKSHNDDVGYVIIVTACFIYIGIAIITAFYKHLLNRIIAMLRGGMIGLIYARSLCLEEGANHDSAAVTLMSTDVETISSAVISAYEIWAQVIEVIIGFSLLTKKLGWVSITPFVIIVLCSRISTRIGTHVGKRRRAWLGAQQKRIGMTSSMLGSMKSLKMMGLANIVEGIIQGQRVLEIELSKKFRWMIVWLNSLGSAVPILAPTATFIVYAVQTRWRGSEPLDTNLAFTSLALFSIVSSPAASLITNIPGLASAKVCLDRIQKFLLDPSREDNRHLIERSSQISGDTFSTGDEVQLDTAPLIDLDAAISIENLTVRPSPTSEPALTNLNLRFDTSTITAIAGPIGSGKSTLLKAILGELPYHGNVYIISSEMGYCAQTPWLQNGTIQQNICGFIDESDIDKVWYRTVLYACALEQDMALLDEGDQSMVGSKGVTLSGGQRQRVALARAVYARLNIVLLDDVLSALDSNTERQIVERLLGANGMFRKLGTTVVLVTHSTQHFHLADQIVVLGSEGKIAQKGTYDTLRSQEGYIGSLLETKQIKKDLESSAIEETTKKSSKSATESKSLEKTRKTGDFAIYRYWFKSVSLPSVFAFIGSAALHSFFRYFCQYWLKWWTEDSDSSHTGRYISIYALLSILALVFEVITILWVLVRIGPKSGEKLHHTLLHTVIRAPQSFFSRVDTGTTLNRFSEDMGLVDRTLPVSAMNVVTRSFQVFAQGILLFGAEKYMSGSIPLCFLALFVIQRVYLQTSRQIRLLDLESKSPVYTQFVETLSGLSTIRAFGRQSQSITTSTLRLDASQRPYYLMLCIQRWLNLALDLLIAALAVLVISLAIGLKGTTTGGQIGIALNVVLGFNSVLLRLVETWTDLETSLGAIARLKNFEIDTISEDQLRESSEPDEKWPQYGGVEFRNVSASYGPNAPALNNITLSIPPGTKLGICGRTGSGKSSLLLTLFRLLDLDSGSIYIDGMDLSTLPRETIRDCVIAIPQDPFFLPSSIRVNLDPSQTLTDEAIIAALDKVGLWEIIEGRTGLKDEMSSLSLSQGQQQLFCLARALLRDSKVVVLDEATSSVDVETDRKMRSVIKEEFGGRTVIVVAHRLDTILACDIVAVLDEGRLVEIGKPGELIDRVGSSFRALKDGS